jgi:hypothetical protein
MIPLLGRNFSAQRVPLKPWALLGFFSIKFLKYAWPTVLANLSFRFCRQERIILLIIHAASQGKTL